MAKVRDPTQCFGSEEFSKHGALFWRDRLLLGATVDAISSERVPRSEELLRHHAGGIPEGVREIYSSAYLQLVRQLEFIRKRVLHSDDGTPAAAFSAAVASGESTSLSSSGRATSIWRGTSVHAQESGAVLIDVERHIFDTEHGPLAQVSNSPSSQRSCVPRAWRRRGDSW